jgi:acyl carrier protein
MGEARANIKRLAKDEIKQIVSRISRMQVADLEDDVLIREELGIDSIQAMEILCKCEEALELKLDETKFANVRTVGEFLSLLTGFSGNSRNE